MSPDADIAHGGGHHGAREHDHGGGPGDDHGAPRIDGLPVRHARLPPGAIVTGCVIVAVAAIVAHARALAAGLVWDDHVFLLDDARVRSLASVWRSFGEAFFTPEHPNEMYRPLVNASLAIDWFLSGSAPGAPRTWWFHGTNVVLHAANAALVYLLFVQLTRRRLGAPLIAAVLWAVHPLAVEPVTWIVGRCDLLATFFGLIAAVLLVRSPGRIGIAAIAAASWGLGLFAKANAATLPLIVALGLVAYHEVAPRRFLTARLARPFLLFLAPAAVWIAARVAVFGGWPFPTGPGLAWHDDVGLAARALGVGRGVWIGVTNLVLPVRLCGDYAGDAAWRPHESSPGISGVFGLVVLGACVVVGARLLRRHAAGFPLLAFAVALVPVLQVVPIGAIVADRFLYLPSAFALLLVAEGLEHLYYRWGPLRGLAPTLLLFVVLPALSWVRAGVWRDEPTFFRDVVAQYPHADDANYRLAKALSETGSPADRAEALAVLRGVIGRSPQPDDELSLLGALQLEDGDLAGAEATLRRALHAAGGKALLGARVRYNLAVCLKRQGRGAEGVPHLEEALRRAPGLDAARRLLATLR